MKQTSDENKEKHQLGGYQLIQYQILQNKIIRIIRQTVRRITNEILGARELKVKDFWKSEISYSINIHSKYTFITQQREVISINLCLRYS